mmetsp:Transcript_29121/g.53521  ORF Transcript_29121/g.53521 Transcript_29121/m.53521 type:complete len:98 (+) Transcript_29121:100-393(+)|eukprot:CAMPEP_0175047846 /NCGR_PEP_ID=MMETSP0052_2-20121109/5836_1 /TAXON_ID=51329 ORGANISM="Polytomella parva, Strain SAG 63-3" /NCGR_SAMPLE_ID=MMETSP0052_2 /ASSEMBLY_ACC=CAM_ASM_000194 /LENGTH=97 /DNA_ID=CAMNT_0016311795 /DNA_START=28 /DNA_END=321 /DNA_ORIENTATION=-
MKLKLEFSGGLDTLFNNIKFHEVDIPTEKTTITCSTLIKWARDNLLAERPELFMKGDTVRPGILVLINDSDWELCGSEEADIVEGDNIVFISTLHGG